MPSSVTATGIMAEALTKMEALIAGTSAFQTEVGAASAAEAKERIYYPHLENSQLDETKWLYDLPYCILTNGPHNGRKDSDSTWARSGRISALFRVSAEFDIKDISALKDSYLAFTNFIGDMLAEIEEDSNVNDAITIQSYAEVQVAQLNPPLETSDQEKRCPYWESAFEFIFDPVGDGEGGAV